MADAEASRVRLMAAANAERMTSEAALLNKSPLLINKIVAERLSDKIQVVMVPSDGKFFFANDVFKSMAEQSGGQAGDGQRRTSRARAWALINSLAGAGSSSRLSL